MFKKNWKKYLLLFVVSVLIYLAFSVFRGHFTIFTLEGFALSSVVYFIVYFAFTLWMLHKFRDRLDHRYIFLAILLGNCFIDIIYYLVSSSSLHDLLLPDFLLRILAITVAWVVFMVRSMWLKVLLFMAAFAICLWVVVFGYDYILHKSNHGTYDGVIDIEIEQPIAFQTHEGDTVQLAQLLGEYVVLDFFSSSCGVCFEELPQVQQLHDAYADGIRVKLYTVHCRESTVRAMESFASGDSLLCAEGYDMPCLSVQGGDPAIVAVGVERYPTVLIYDKAADKFVFRGDISNVQARLAALLGR